MGNVTSSSDVYRAVADPTRRALLDLLTGSERTVNELADPFGMTQPAISQHLRVLREAGLVTERREGRSRLYQLNPAPLNELYEWASRHRQVRDPEGHVWAFQRARRLERLGPAVMKRLHYPLALAGGGSVRVMVSDQDRAIRFFTQKVGLEVRRDEPMKASLRWIEIAPRGGMHSIVLCTPGFASPEQRPAWQSQIGTVTGVTFYSDDVESACEELAARGVEISGKPERRPRSGIRAAFKDEDNNQYELIRGMYKQRRR